MKTYTVRAKRWRYGWELHIEGEGVTQSRSLATAARQVRDYVMLLHDLADDQDIAVTLIPELGRPIDVEVAAARDAVAELAVRQREVAALSRDIARRLADEGLKGAEIAAVLGISAQRVSQLKATSDNQAGKRVGATKSTTRVVGPAHSKSDRSS